MFQSSLTSLLDDQSLTFKGSINQGGDKISKNQNWCHEMVVYCEHSLLLLTWLLPLTWENSWSVVANTGGVDSDTLHRLAHPFSSTVFSIALNTMSLSQELPFDSNALTGWPADYGWIMWGTNGQLPCPKVGQLYGTIHKPEFSRGSGWVWTAAGLTPLPSPVLLCVPHFPVSSLEHINKPPAQEPPALTMILWNLT